MLLHNLEIVDRNTFYRLHACHYHFVLPPPFDSMNCILNIYWLAHLIQILIQIWDIWWILKTSSCHNGNNNKCNSIILFTMHQNAIKQDQIAFWSIWLRGYLNGDIHRSNKKYKLRYTSYIYINYIENKSNIWNAYIMSFRYW